jgi:hypothetical protein
MSATVRIDATRMMFSASGSEMKRHFVVVRLKTKQITTLKTTNSGRMRSNSGRRA